MCVCVCVCVRACVCISLYRKAFLYSELHTRNTDKMCCHNTDYVPVNGHDRTALVILAEYCIVQGSLMMDPL